MFNHVRTLLLNQDGNSRPAPGFFGEEAVPRSFKAVQLPSTMLNVVRALFGGAPDNAGRNLMLWHYMRLLHSTEFVEYVLAFDSRITYIHDKTLVDAAFGPSFNTNPEGLQLLGKPGLGGEDGRLQDIWLIERPVPTTLRITNTRTSIQSEQTITFQDGVSNYVAFPSHPDFQVRVFDALATTALWNLTYTAKPEPTLDPINRAARLTSAGDRTISDLFPRRDPFPIFRELWEQHSQFPYKISGALLALAFRIEEIRNGA